MNLAEAHELGAFEARDQAQNPRLLAESQVVLESHQVVAVGAQVLLAQLHHGVRPAPGARIDQSHRLHGAEAQRLAAAPRQLFDGQAGFEIRRLVFRDMGRHALAGEQRVEEALVLLAVERAVDVVVGAVERLAVARGAEGDVHGRCCRLRRSG